MDTIFIITGMLLIFGSMLFASISESPIRLITIFIGFLGIIIFGIGVDLSAKKHVNIIPAIDVYRGKTTLQITYQDSIAIDSVVVYKK